MKREWFFCFSLTLIFLQSLHLTGMQRQDDDAWLKDFNGFDHRNLDWAEESSSLPLFCPVKPQKKPIDVDNLRQDILDLACSKRNFPKIYEILNNCRGVHNIVNTADLYGETILHSAARDGLHQLIYVLGKAYHANPNVRNKQGKTPLHIAVEVGGIASVNVLLKNPRIDISIMDSLGLQVFDYAILAFNESKKERDIVKRKYNLQLWQAIIDKLLAYREQHQS